MNKNFYCLTLCMLLAANIAFLVYSYWGWSEGVWSVVTVAALANRDFVYMTTKMWTRLVGTLVGAVYAFCIVYYFHGHLLLLCLMLSVGVFAFTLLAFQKNDWNYSGLIANVTLFIVLGTAINGDYSASALHRIGQVVFGIVLLALVNSVITFYFMNEIATHRLLLPRLRALFQSTQRFVLNRANALVSVKMVLAMLLTIVPWLIFKYPGGFWAPISCFFILEESVEKTRQKSRYRFICHVLTASFGLIAVLMLRQHTDLLFVPLSLGLIVCSYILCSNHLNNTTGNTMGIALAIMLLAEPNSPIEIIVARFLNVMLGIAVGLLIARYIKPGA